MVHHARGQALAAFVQHRVRGLSDDGQVGRELQDAAGGLVAVHLGHLDVHQHDVVGVAAVGQHAVDRLAAVAHDGGSGTLELQRALQHELVDLVVLGHQHTHAVEASRGVAPGGVRRALRLARGRGHEGQAQLEDAARAGLAAHQHDAAHQLGQAAADGQAQPGAAEAPRGGRVGLLERVEQMPQVFRRDADAAVGDAVDHLRGRAVVAGLQAHPHVDAAGLGELDRVGQQVHQHLLRTQAVAQAALGQRGVEDQVQADRLLGGAIPQQRDRLLGQRAWRDRPLFDAQLAHLQLGEVQHVVDDAQQQPARVEDGRERVDGALVARVAQADLRQPQQAVERRADLVAHVGEELALRVGQLHRAQACALAIGLQRVAVGDVAHEHDHLVAAQRQRACLEVALAVRIRQGVFGHHQALGGDGLVDARMQRRGGLRRQDVLDAAAEQLGGVHVAVHVVAHAEVHHGAVPADAEIAVGHRVQHPAQLGGALRDDAFQLELAVFQRARGQALRGEVEVRREHQVLAPDGHAHRRERRVEDVARARAERRLDVAHLARAVEHRHRLGAGLDVHPRVELQAVAADGLFGRVAEHRDERVVDLHVALVLVARQGQARRAHAEHRGEARLAVAQRGHRALALLGEFVALQRAADVLRQPLQQRELTGVEELDRRRVHREHGHGAPARLQRIGRGRPVAERQRAVAPGGHAGIGADVGGVHRTALAEGLHAGRVAARADGQRGVRRIEVAAGLAGPGHGHQLAGGGFRAADPGHAQAAVAHHDLADGVEQRLGRALARDGRVHVGEHLVEPVEAAQVALVVAPLRHVAADAQHAGELPVRAEHRRMQRLHQLLVTVVRVGERELVRHRRAYLDRAPVGGREFGGHRGRQEGAGRLAQQLVLGRADEALEAHIAREEAAVDALEPDEVGQRVDQRAQAPRLAVDLGSLLAHGAPQRQPPQHRDDHRQPQRPGRHGHHVQPA